MKWIQDFELNRLTYYPVYPTYAWREIRSWEYVSMASYYRAQDILSLKDWQDVIYNI